MTIFSLARARVAPLRPVLRNLAVRTAYSGPTVDYEHFSAGWNHISDISEFTKPGKYTTQTFNKISPSVGRLFLMFIFDSCADDGDDIFSSSILNTF